MIDDGRILGTSFAENTWCPVNTHCFLVKHECVDTVMYIIYCINLLETLIGIPAPRLIHAIIQSVNLTTATSIKSWGGWVTTADDHIGLSAKNRNMRPQWAQAHPNWTGLHLTDCFFLFACFSTPLCVNCRGGRLWKVQDISSFWNTQTIHLRLTTMPWSKTLRWHVSPL